MYAFAGTTAVGVVEASSGGSFAMAVVGESAESGAT